MDQPLDHLHHLPFLPYRGGDVAEGIVSRIIEQARCATGELPSFSEPLAVLSESGSGKSILIARVADRVMRKEGGSLDYLVLFAQLKQAAGPTLMEEVCSSLGLGRFPDFEALRDALPEPLDTQRIVLFIDSLDESEHRAQWIDVEKAARTQADVLPVWVSRRHDWSEFSPEEFKGYQGLILERDSLRLRLDEDPELATVVQSVVRRFIDDADDARFIDDADDGLDDDLPVDAPEEDLTNGLNASSLNDYLMWALEHYQILHIPRTISTIEGDQRQRFFARVLTSALKHLARFVSRHAEVRWDLNDPRSWGRDVDHQALVATNLSNALLVASVEEVLEQVPGSHIDEAKHLVQTMISEYARDGIDRLAENKGYLADAIPRNLAAEHLHMFAALSKVGLVLRADHDALQYRWAHRDVTLMALLQPLLLNPKPEALAAVFEKATAENWSVLLTAQPGHGLRRSEQFHRKSGRAVAFAEPISALSSADVADQSFTGIWEEVHRFLPKRPDPLEHPTSMADVVEWMDDSIAAGPLSDKECASLLKRKSVRRLSEDAGVRINRTIEAYLQKSEDERVVATRYNFASLNKSYPHLLAAKVPFAESEDHAVAYVRHQLYQLATGERSGAISTEQYAVGILTFTLALFNSPTGRPQVPYAPQGMTKVFETHIPKMFEAIHYHVARGRVEHPILHSLQLIYDAQSDFWGPIDVQRFEHYRETLLSRQAAFAAAPFFVDIFLHSILMPKLLLSLKASTKDDDWFLIKRLVEEGIEDCRDPATALLPSEAFPREERLWRITYLRWLDEFLADAEEAYLNSVAFGMIVNVRAQILNEIHRMLTEADESAGKRHQPDLRYLRKACLNCLERIRTITSFREGLPSASNVSQFFTTTSDVMNLDSTLNSRAFWVPPSRQEMFYFIGFSVKFGNVPVVPHDDRASVIPVVPNGENILKAINKWLEKSKERGFADLDRWKVLFSLSNQSPVPTDGIPKQLPPISAVGDKRFTAEQLSLISKAVPGRPILFKGPPGTGKTWVATELLLRTARKWNTKNWIVTLNAHLANDIKANMENNHRSGPMHRNLVHHEGVEAGNAAFKRLVDDVTVLDVERIMLALAEAININEAAILTDSLLSSVCFQEEFLSHWKVKKLLRTNKATAAALWPKALWDFKNNMFASPSEVMQNSTHTFLSADDYITRTSKNVRRVSNSLLSAVPDRADSEAVMRAWHEILAKKISAKIFPPQFIMGRLLLQMTKAQGGTDWMKQRVVPVVEDYLGHSLPDALLIDELQDLSISEMLGLSLLLQSSSEDANRLLLVGDQFQSLNGNHFSWETWLNDVAHEARGFINTYNEAGQHDRRFPEDHLFQKLALLDEHSGDTLSVNMRSDPEIVDLVRTAWGWAVDLEHEQNKEAMYLEANLHAERLTARVKVHHVKPEENLVNVTLALLTEAKRFVDLSVLAVDLGVADAIRVALNERKDLHPEVRMTTVYDPSMIKGLERGAVLVVGPFVASSQGEFPLLSESDANLRKEDEAILKVLFHRLNQHTHVGLSRARHATTVVMYATDDGRAVRTNITHNHDNMALKQYPNPIHQWANEAPSRASSSLFDAVSLLSLYSNDELDRMRPYIRLDEIHQEHTRASIDANLRAQMGRVREAFLEEFSSLDEHHPFREDLLAHVHGHNLPIQQSSYVQRLIGLPTSDANDEYGRFWNEAIKPDDDGVWKILTPQELFNLVRYWRVAVEAFERIQHLRRRDIRSAETLADEKISKLNETLLGRFESLIRNDVDIIYPSHLDRLDGAGARAITDEMLLAHLLTRVQRLDFSRLAKEAPTDDGLGLDPEWSATLSACLAHPKVRSASATSFFRGLSNARAIGDQPHSWIFNDPVVVDFFKAVTTQKISTSDFESFYSAALAVRDWGLGIGGDDVHDALDPSVTAWFVSMVARQIAQRSNDEWALKGIRQPFIQSMSNGSASVNAQLLSETIDLIQHHFDRESSRIEPSTIFTRVFPEACLTLVQTLPTEEVEEADANSALLSMLHTVMRYMDGVRAFVSHVFSSAVSGHFSLKLNANTAVNLMHVSVLCQHIGELRLWVEGYPVLSQNAVESRETLLNDGRIVAVLDRAMVEMIKTRLNPDGISTPALQRLESTITGLRDAYNAPEGQIDVEVVNLAPWERAIFGSLRWVVSALLGVSRNSRPQLLEPEPGLFGLEWGLGLPYRFFTEHKPGFLEMQGALHEENHPIQRDYLAWKLASVLPLELPPSPLSFRWYEVDHASPVIQTNADVFDFLQASPSYIEEVSVQGQRRLRVVINPFDQVGRIVEPTRDSGEFRYVSRMPNSKTMAEATRALVNLPRTSRKSDDFDMSNHHQLDELRRLMADMQKEPLSERDRELLQLQLNPMYPPVESIDSGATSARSTRLMVGRDYELFHDMILQRIEEGPTWRLHRSTLEDGWRRVNEDFFADDVVEFNVSRFSDAPIHDMVGWLCSGMLFTWE